jgi:hypothetical protein
MASFHNIEKSVFRRGQYVGYADGVWIIRRTNSSFSKWAARHRDDKSAPLILAWRLDEMSKKLEEHGKSKAAKTVFIFAGHWQYPDDHRACFVNGMRDSLSYMEATEKEAEEKLAFSNPFFVVESVSTR